VEIQKQSAQAWRALAQGHNDASHEQKRVAAPREDETEKNAVTPGPLAPARELLGEMLLELHRPADALREFEATLAREPDRFCALAGAMNAARESHERTAAAKHSGRLVAVCSRADVPGRQALVDARGVAR
jgi:hypothetical protein